MSIFTIVFAINTLSAAISASLAGAFWWWVFIERPLKPTFYRGTIFGFLTVISSHTLHAAIAGLLNLPLVGGDVPGGFDVSGSVPSLVELSEITKEVAFWAYFSLSIAGIMTIPIGIFIGVVLVVLRQNIPS
jgi:hypothetical protein